MENKASSSKSKDKEDEATTTHQAGILGTIINFLWKFSGFASTSRELAFEESDLGASGSDDSAKDPLSQLVENLKLTDEASEEAVLDNQSLTAVAEYMNKPRCRNVIVMVGAGISTSAGIPDFRSPGTGIYSTLQKYNLPSPQCMFNIDYFMENPAPFYQFAKDLFPTELKPTPCHYFLRLLNDKGKLLRLYTQNIDTLERIAGLPPDKLVEAHGTFSTSHCLNRKCREEYDLAWLKSQLDVKEVPLCVKCGGIVKPDVIFFGEILPDRFHNLVMKDFPQCDLLIVIGTSLTVAPFANLVDMVPNNTPRLLINNKRCGESRFTGLFGGKGGFDFDSDTKTRDVLWLGTCDDGCFALAEALGYADELRDLIDREHARLGHQTP